MSLRIIRPNSKCSQPEQTQAEREHQNWLQRDEPPINKTASKQGDVHVILRRTSPLMLSVLSQKKTVCDQRWKWDCFDPHIDTQTWEPLLFNWTLPDLIRLTDLAQGQV